MTPGGAPNRAGSALAWRSAQQIGVKLIFLVRTPVLAHLLSPDDFGLMAIGLVALDILMRLTDLGMIQALVQREDPESRHYQSVWTVGLIRSLIVAVGVFLLAPAISELFGDVRAKPIIQALALRPLVTALASIGVADLRRNLNFKRLAIIRLSEGGLDAVVAVILAPVIGVWALVAGAVAGQVVFVALSYALAPRRPRFVLDRPAAISLIRFGRWIFLSGLIGLAGRFLLQTVISRQLGTVELGLYYLGAKIAYTMTEVSWEIIGSVTFPLISRIQQDRARVQRTLLLLLKGMAGLLIPMGALIIGLAPSIALNLLGPQWVGVEQVIQVMVVSTVIAAFSDALVPVFNGLGRPHYDTLLTAVRTVVMAALVWEAAGSFGLVGAAAAWIPAAVVTQVVAYILIRRIFSQPLKGLGVTFLCVVLASVLGAGLARSIMSMMPGIAGLILASVIGSAVMGGLLLLFDIRWRLGLTDLFDVVSPRFGARLRRIVEGAR